MLRTSTISTYLRGDWHRDWGSVEKYYPLVPAGDAPVGAIEQGVITVPGWSRQGPIRALP
jgi:arabinosyltransferase A